MKSFQLRLFPGEARTQHPFRIMLGGMQGMAAEFQWGSEPAKQVAMLGSVATIDVGAAFWPPVASREWKASFRGWERGFFMCR